MTDTPRPSMFEWIAKNPGWAALATFATLLALLVFFVDLAYRSQIEDLRRKVQDREGEVAALTKANRDLQARLHAPAFARLQRTTARPAAAWSSRLLSRIPPSSRSASPDGELNAKRMRGTGYSSPRGGG